MRMRRARINPRWMEKSTPCERLSLQICLSRHLGEDAYVSYWPDSVSAWPVVERPPTHQHRGEIDE